MKRTIKLKILFSLMVAVLLGSGSVLWYRASILTTRDPVATPSDANAPQMMVSHAAASEKEHEVKALLGELQQNPDHVPILMRLAQTSRDSGKLNDAIGYLRGAVAQDPKNVDANLELGRALFETGDVKGAIRSTEHVLEINPSHVDALYNLGAIYGNMFDDARARQYWEKAASVAPESESGRRAKENLAKLR